MASLHQGYPRYTTAGALAALVLGLSAPAQAQEAEELPPIIVEAAGLEAVEAERLGSAHTVITGEELERRQIRHAAEALRAVAGLHVGRVGGVGTQTQVRVRGAEANHVAVFIDGVEVNSLDAGDFQFETLLAEDIERIEVLRGPQSGVYGANALAGVINIVTTKGTGAPRVTTSAEAGSMNTRQVAANASGGTDAGYLSVSAVTRETEGFNIAREGTEKDGSEQKAIFARGGVSPTENFHIDAMARLQSNTTDIDSDTDSDGLLDDAPGLINEREQKLARLGATLDLFDKRWTHKVFADYLSDDFTSRSPTSEFVNNGERRHYGYQTAVQFDIPAFLNSKNTLTGLVEHKDESFATRSDFASGDAERAQTGFVAEYDGAYFSNLFLTANVRHDLNDSFEDATTYRTTVAYLLPGRETKWHASYGKGITNPTFFEQFGFALNFRGNPDLEPEQSIGWDVGVEQGFFGNALVVDVTYFNATLTDKIQGFGDTVINLAGESERQGMELQFTVRPTSALTLTGSYTYTHATDPDGSQEIRRPKHAAALNAGYAFAEGRGQVNLGVIYNGNMQDQVFDFTAPFFPSVTLDDYLLVNFSGSYKLDDRITLFGRVENLLDQDYEEVFGFSSAPIAAYGGIKVSLHVDPPLEERE